MMQIVGNGMVLRRQPVVIAKGPLAVSAWREGDRLQFQINDGQPMVFFDVIPLHGSPTNVFGLDWPAGVGLCELRASVPALPEAASPLEPRGQVYAEGRHTEPREM